MLGRGPAPTQIPILISESVLASSGPAASTARATSSCARPSAGYRPTNSLYVPGRPPFAVVAGFAQTGLPAEAWKLAAPHLTLTTGPGVTWFTSYTLIGSNLFSTAHFPGPCTSCHAGANANGWSFSEAS